MDRRNRPCLMSAIAGQQLWPVLCILGRLRRESREQRVVREKGPPGTHSATRVWSEHEHIKKPHADTECVVFQLENEVVSARFARELNGGRRESTSESSPEIAIRHVVGCRTATHQESTRRHGTCG